MNQTTQEKKTRNDLSLWRGKTRITTKELYDWLAPWIQQSIDRERKKGRTLKRGVNYEEFMSIVNDYLDRSLKYVIDSGRSFEFGHRFGDVRVVKTECILYNPKKVYFKTINNKKTRHVEKYRQTVLGDGMVPFMIWNHGSKKKMFQLKLSKRWKKLIAENHRNKVVDYMDYTMDKESARRASIIYKRTNGR